MKVALSTINVEMIRSWNPCYDPSEVVAEDWSGTIADVLGTDKISITHRLWLVLRPELLPESLLDEFSIWCNLQAVHLWNTPEIVVDFLKTGNEEIRAAAWDAVWEEQLEKLLSLIEEMEAQS